MTKIIIAALLTGAVGAYSGYAVNEQINEPVEISCDQAFAHGNFVGCVEKTGVQGEFLFFPCNGHGLWTTIRYTDASAVPGGCGVSE